MGVSVTSACGRCLTQRQRFRSLSAAIADYPYVTPALCRGPPRRCDHRHWFRYTVRAGGVSDIPTALDHRALLPGAVDPDTTLRWRGGVGREGADRRRRSLRLLDICWRPRARQGRMSRREPFRFACTPGHPCGLRKTRERRESDRPVGKGDKGGRIHSVAVNLRRHRQARPIRLTRLAATASAAKPAPTVGGMA